jgi:hypothetical protein
VQEKLLGLCRIAPKKRAIVLYPPKSKHKKQSFVDTTIANVESDLPFRRKSATEIG